MASGAETWVGFLVEDSAWVENILPFALSNRGVPTLRGLGIGLRFGSATISAFGLGTSESYYGSVGELNDGETHFVVGRFRFFDGQDDEISLWVDPDLAGPLEADGVHVMLNLNLPAASYNYFGVNKGSGGFDNSAVDEIRVGSDFSSVAMPVVPEPSSVILIGLGLSVLASRRRDFADS